MTLVSAQRTYTYKSRGAGGKLVKGTLEAASEQAAASRLGGMGLAPIEITEKLAGTGLNAEVQIPGLSKGVKVRDLATAFRQLATMTSSGLSLMRAMTVVGEQTRSPKLAGVLQETAREIESGSALSESLARHPREIPPLVVHMLRAGETGGFLDTALDSIATTFEKESKLRSTIKSAMTYPVVVLAVAALAVVGMLLFIVPVFKEMFEGFGKSLPLPTQLLVDVSNQMYWLLPTTIVAMIVGSAVWKAKKNDDAVRRVVHPAVLRLPVFGPLIGKIAVARFTRNLANMTSAGVPLLKALTIVGRTSGNWVVERASDRMAESVRVGGSLAAPLAQERIFPPMVTQMIAIGEEAGSVDDMLGKVADIYDSEIEATAEALTSLIEPLLIVFLGVVVGGMIVALYLPIFNIATAVH